MAEKTTTKELVMDILEPTAFLLDAIKKDYGHYTYTLGNDSPADIKDWVSTGSTLLDLIISNKPKGGFPAGRINLIYGPSSSAKSLIIAHCIKSCQDQGGVAVLIEPEISSSLDFLQAIGVDIANLIYMVMPTVEETFEAIDTIIEKIRKQYPNKLVFIAVDSLTSLKTKKEAAAGYELEGYAMEKAKLISFDLRKINESIGKMKICLVMTSQTRANVNATMFEEKECVDPFSTKIKIRYQK